MKKTAIITAVLILLTCIAAYAQDQPAQKMRVVVEGEEESAVANDLQKPVLLPKATPEKKHIAKNAAELKAMAEKSAMENEIIDAMIAKLADLEVEVKSLQNSLIACSLVLLCSLLALAAHILITRKKSKGN